MAKSMAVAATAVRSVASPAARKASVFTALRHPSAMWRLLTDKSAPKAPRVLAVLVLLYAVLPFDAVPDVMPVIGWLDDMGLVSLAIGYVASAAARYANENEGVLPAPKEA